MQRRAAPQHAVPPLEPAVSPAAIARAMSAAVAILVAAHAVVLVMRYGFGHDRLLGIGPLFDMWREANVPTFASALGLAFCALLLGLVARHAAAAGERGRWHWRFMAVVFLFLAADEMLALHDRMTGPLRAALGASGALYHAWVVPYLAALLLLGAAYLPFLWRLERATRTRFLVAAVLYLSGAIGLEMVDAVFYERVEARTLLIDAFNAVEEILEMLGITVFAWALAHELARRRAALSFDAR